MKQSRLFKSVVLLVISFVVIGAAVTLSFPERGNENPVCEKLSPHSFSIISQPDSVEIYEMSPAFQKGIAKLGPYHVKSEGNELDANAIAKFKEIILNFNHYRFDPIKKCLFAPQYGFRFVKNGDEVFVFVSLSCQQIKIQYKEDSLVADFDSAIEEFGELISSIEENKTAALAKHSIIY